MSAASESLLTGIACETALDFLGTVRFYADPPGSSNISALDRLIFEHHPHSSESSSLNRGDVIELQGPAGSGKTQLTYFLALTTILPFTWAVSLANPASTRPPRVDTITLGGRNRSVAVFDVDKRWSALRLKEMVRAHLKRRIDAHCDLIPTLYNARASSDATEAMLELAMARVYIFETRDTIELAAGLAGLPSYAERERPNEEIAMIIVDSISSCYWQDRYTNECASRASRESRSETGPATARRPLKAEARAFSQALRYLAAARTRLGAVVVLTNASLGVYEPPRDQIEPMPAPTDFYRQHLPPPYPNPFVRDEQRPAFDPGQPYATSNLLELTCHISLHLPTVDPVPDGLSLQKAHVDTLRPRSLRLAQHIGILRIPHVEHGRQIGRFRFGVRPHATVSLSTRSSPSPPPRDATTPSKANGRGGGQASTTPRRRTDSMKRSLKITPVESLPSSRLTRSASKRAQTVNQISESLLESPSNRRGRYFGSNSEAGDRELSSQQDEESDASLGDEDDDLSHEGEPMAAGEASRAGEVLKKRQLKSTNGVPHFGAAAWDQLNKRVSQLPSAHLPVAFEHGWMSSEQPKNVANGFLSVNALLPRRRGSNQASSDTGTAYSDTASAKSSMTDGARKGKGWRIPVRWPLVPEVCVLALVFALVLRQANASALSAPLAVPVSFGPIILLVAIVPFIAILRRTAPVTYLMVPFTDERGYRDASAADDGFAVGALLPPMVATAVFADACYRGETPLRNIRALVDQWSVAGTQNVTVTSASELHELQLQARAALMLMITINSYILVLHVFLARTILKVSLLPRNNTKRFFGAVVVSAGVGALISLALVVARRSGHGLMYNSPTETFFCAFLYQMSLYTISRLARRGFTLGELSIVSSSGVSLCLEFWRLSVARWHFLDRPSIPATFRDPTAITAFQHVLIPGAFLSGFILSPLLIMSRHVAQKPAHRLKWPERRERSRRLLALAVFGCLILIVLGPLAGWTGWVFGGGITYAWEWALRYTIFGGDGIKGMHAGEITGWRRWRRLVLVFYWLAVITAAIGGWQTRLVRARKVTMGRMGSADGKASSKSNVESAREERRIHVSLDLRRKFFHALAVLLFVPAIALDTSFTSLAFSFAFAVFTFAEYARYFALYPIGAPIHVFFNEFIDSKDSGPVVVSHFYLLTGCASGVWLDTVGIKLFTGVLVLGVGDALASIIGRRVGTVRWPGSSKTLIGSFAFVASTVSAAELLKLIGLSPPFSTLKYLLATCLTALFEATSSQNDNLTCPILMWSALAALQL
ncbi:uncharacterized protein L969DRAFT_91296 [Mixia osmundae IAM 14324]|uniref:dolichol kinase n=1 Tax=Mixia osmundae (strain CBS 9802 / IAM 14324 / JCM 22182 / KY 12970) TaxID=764103 RepID=G7DSS3_MIXOS|nr:uncharacterized protein L969DRAFT_91296 [Mixia osmundae IAM 14324]KEI41815.1 hypothetical protein L969DRAFT_91296 [Mixia osmundae IAM 14324]GAA93631.1 hypothetical protein E5Q_00275 [Mixia osmundae IAM 14324]